MCTAWAHLDAVPSDRREVDQRGNRCALVNLVVQDLERGRAGQRGCTEGLKNPARMDRVQDRQRLRYRAFETHALASDRRVLSLQTDGHHYDALDRFTAKRHHTWGCGLPEETIPRERELFPGEPRSPRKSPLTRAVSSASTLPVGDVACMHGRCAPTVRPALLPWQVGWTWTTTATWGRRRSPGCEDDLAACGTFRGRPRGRA